MQCNAMPCHAMHTIVLYALQCNCNTIQYNAMAIAIAMQCNAIKYNTIQCNAMQCNTLQSLTFHCSCLHINSLPFSFFFRIIFFSLFACLLDGRLVLCFTFIQLLQTLVLLFSMLYYYVHSTRRRGYSD